MRARIRNVSLTQSGSTTANNHHLLLALALALVAELWYICARREWYRHKNEAVTDTHAVGWQIVHGGCIEHVARAHIELRKRA